jgi:hypothetical protein
LWIISDLGDRSRYDLSIAGDSAVIQFSW